MAHNSGFFFACRHFYNHEYFIRPEALKFGTKLQRMTLEQQPKNWASEFTALPRLYNGPIGSAQFRSSPSDFMVTEQLGFVPEGEGEHQFVRIKKTQLNTMDVAQWLAKCAKLKPMDVGFCGLKDKYAVTEQWFSLYLPGKEEVPITAMEGMEIMERTRHIKKLRRGTHQCNRFELILRHCTETNALWDERLGKIVEGGFVNYFGEQRFGLGFQNLNRATALFNGSIKRVKRQQKSFYLSAARSWLFNQVCSRRINNERWDKTITSDRLILNGTRSFFVAEQTPEELSRLKQLDIHISAPLWGKIHRDELADPLFTLEEQWLEEYDTFKEGLASAGLKMERRAMRALAQNLQWQWLDTNTLQLKFDLDNGCFATSLLQELADCTTGVQK
jgi:tRNA pseudouridine13 synthase